MPCMSWAHFICSPRSKEHFNENIEQEAVRVQDPRENGEEIRDPCGVASNPRKEAFSLNRPSSRLQIIV